MGLHMGCIEMNSKDVFGSQRKACDQDGESVTLLSAGSQYTGYTELHIGELV